MNAYQRNVVFLISFYLLFPTVLIAINFTADPHNRYHASADADDLKRLAGSDSRLLLVPENYDDRVLIEKFARYVQDPEIVILGGSRVMNVRADFFGEPSSVVLNAGVTAGTVRDYIALWQLLKSRGLKPRIVFIGIEEQSVHTASQNERYLSLYDYYSVFYEGSFSMRYSILKITTTVKDLLSWETTLSTFKIIRKDRSSFWKLIPRDAYSGETPARSGDLSMVYPADAESKPVLAVRNAAVANGLGEIQALGKWNPSHEKGLVALQNLVDDMAQSGAVVILIGMPYHPAAFDLVEKNDQAAKNLKNLVGRFEAMAKPGTVFYYDAILKFRDHFTEEDFFDGAHLKVSASKKLFRLAGERLNRK